MQDVWFCLLGGMELEPAVLGDCSLGCMVLDIGGGAAQISWAPLVSPDVNGVLRTWGGTMSRYPLAGGARGEGFLLACAGAVCMGWCYLLCHDASVGTRGGVCLCAHHVVSVMLRVWLLAIPPNRRCRHRGALFAMFPLVRAGGCLNSIVFAIHPCVDLRRCSF